MPGSPDTAGTGGNRDGQRRAERRRPVGIDRAKQATGTPPPTPRAQAEVAKPELPEDLTPNLPSEVLRELRTHAREHREAAVAMTLAQQAVADGEPERAVTPLEWVKSQAPRAPSVREALGIARYLSEDFSRALSELHTYRRLSGRQDQNHLIADCLRALGRPVDQVGEAVSEMSPETDGPDRHAEGMIVWAAALADDGQVGAGRAVLDRAVEIPGDPDDIDQRHVRLWYVAGTLAERDGDDEQAAVWFRRVADLDDDLFDVSERLRRLEGE